MRRRWKRKEQHEKERRATSQEIVAENENLLLQLTFSYFHCDFFSLKLSLNFWILADKMVPFYRWIFAKSLKFYFQTHTYVHTSLQTYACVHTHIHKYFCCSCFWNGSTKTFRKRFSFFDLLTDFLCKYDTLKRLFSQLISQCLTFAGAVRPIQWKLH